MTRTKADIIPYIIDKVRKSVSDPFCLACAGTGYEAEPTIDHFPPGPRCLSSVPPGGVKDYNCCDGECPFSYSYRVCKTCHGNEVTTNVNNINFILDYSLYRLQQISMGKI